MHRKTRGEKFGQGWDDALPAIRAKRIFVDQVRLPSIRHQAYTAVRPGRLVRKKTRSQRLLFAAGIVTAITMFSTGGVGIVILSSHGAVSLPQAAPTPAQEALNGSPATKKQKAGNTGRTDSNPPAAPAGQSKAAETSKKPAQTADDKKRAAPTAEEEAAVKQSPPAAQSATTTGDGTTPAPTPSVPPSPPVTPESDTADTMTVTFNGSTFDITNVMIDRGGMLTFVNAGTSELRPVCTNGVSDLCTGAVIAPGASWSTRPATAGGWTFRDSSSPSAGGTLTVY